MARIIFNWHELYSGKAGSFLDHVVLAECLDTAATWTGGWMQGNSHDADYNFAEELETVVLVNAFNDYWQQLSPSTPIYLKCLDSENTVPLIGYQFNIDDENPFTNPNSSRGFPGISLES
jgi:hypothetical protein